MRFLLDENLPLRVATGLAAAGHDVARVASLCPGADDATVLERACAEERVLVTADLDFGRLVMASGRRCCGVVLVRLEQARLDRLAADLAALASRWAPPFDEPGAAGSRSGAPGRLAAGRRGSALSTAPPPAASSMSSSTPSPPSSSGPDPGTNAAPLSSSGEDPRIQPGWPGLRPAMTGKSVVPECLVRHPRSPLSCHPRAQTRGSTSMAGSSPGHDNEAATGRPRLLRRLRPPLPVMVAPRRDHPAWVARSRRAMTMKRRQAGPVSSAVSGRLFLSWSASEPTIHPGWPGHAGP